MATRADVAKRAAMLREEKAWNKRMEQEMFDSLFKQGEAGGGGRLVRFTAEEYGVTKLRAIRREAYKRRGLKGQLVYRVYVIGDWEAIDVACVV